METNCRVHRHENCERSGQESKRSSREKARGGGSSTASRGCLDIGVANSIGEGSSEVPGLHGAQVEVGQHRRISREQDPQGVPRSVQEDSPAFEGKAS